MAFKLILQQLCVLIVVLANQESLMDNLQAKLDENISPNQQKLIIETIRVYYGQAVEVIGLEEEKLI